MASRRAFAARGFGLQKTTPMSSCKRWRREIRSATRAPHASRITLTRSRPRARAVFPDFPTTARHPVRPAQSSSCKQRTERPSLGKESIWKTKSIPPIMFRIFHQPLASNVELHHQPIVPKSSPKDPVKSRLPPGNALNPLLLEPSQAGGVAFISFPAVEEPPNSVTKIVHSSSVGTCQPAGQSPRASTTAELL